MTKRKQAKTVEIPQIIPYIQTSTQSEFESLSKFLDANRDDPLHNSIYFCLVNALKITPIDGDSGEKIINVLKLPDAQSNTILALFRERINDIKLRKNIQTEMNINKI